MRPINNAFILRTLYWIYFHVSEDRGHSATARKPFTSELNEIKGAGNMKVK